MADPFRKVRPGEPLAIPASTFNTLMDVARRHTIGGGGGRGPDANGEARQTGIIRVKNTTDDAVPRFGVLGLADPLIWPNDNPDNSSEIVNLDEFKSRVVLKGVTALVPDHLGKFAVLLEPAPVGTIVKACVFGVCPAYVTVADEVHEYAEVKTFGPTLLGSSNVGTARILWKEEGTGEKWAVVRIGDARLPLVHFEVVLEHAGGIPYPVSYTYDVTNPSSGQTLALNAGPQHRPLAGYVQEPATRGTGAYDSDGNFVLISAEETFGDAACNVLDDYGSETGSA
jgi:hypothetical protein